MKNEAKMTIIYSTSLFLMALNKKKTRFRPGSTSHYKTIAFIMLPLRLRFSAYRYYFNYCIMSEHRSHGLSEFRIVLKRSGFRILGLLFLRSRSYCNKPATETPGVLKPDHAYVMIQKAKSSNKNLML